MLIDNPDADIDSLLEIIPGPDFPTGGFINGRAGLIKQQKLARAESISEQKPI